MMDGAPAPTSREVVTITADAPPVTSVRMWPDRDDDPEAWPARYRLSELRLEHGVLGRTRTSHAWLFRPTTPPPAGGYPLMIALNGHTGSAKRMTLPDDEKYWFGDGFARRGYVVLALDMGHRPAGERAYAGYEQGDHPAGGNGVHPRIDPAWSEDGERAWDALRGVEYLRSLPDVNREHLVMVGHSMGAEVAILAGGLDPSISAVVSSAYAADMGVMLHNGNHPCFTWPRGDVREYVDTSDFHALIAPRKLAIVNGATDAIYTRLAPFIEAKQVHRRTMAAYADRRDRLLFYLHYGPHHFHVGDKNPFKAIARGMTVPELVEPETPFTVEWQSDPRTRTLDQTLFEWL